MIESRILLVIVKYIKEQYLLAQWNVQLTRTTYVCALDICVTACIQKNSVSGKNILILCHRPHKNKPLSCHMTKNGDTKNSVCPWYYYEYLYFSLKRTHLKTNCASRTVLLGIQLEKWFYTIISSNRPCFYSGHCRTDSFVLLNVNGTIYSLIPYWWLVRSINYINLHFNCSR